MSKFVKSSSFVLNSMRQKYDISPTVMKNIQWFPGHMGRGLKDIDKRLKGVDIIIEVHDSRIPITGRNRLLHLAYKNIKPVILVYNKRDLIKKEYENKIINKIKEKEKNINEIIFTNCKDQYCKGVSSILPALQKISDKMIRYNRTEVFDTTIMVVGVPNVGKSSLINNLRSSHLKKKKAAQTGPIAGITRKVQSEIKISENPLIYMLDTPGISLPKITNFESGMKLATCATLQDRLVGEVNIADYILYIMNKNNNFRYVDYFNLDQPTDNIQELLTKAAIKRGTFKNRIDLRTNSIESFPDLQNTAISFINQFRKGNFGLFMLDTDMLELDR